MTKEEIYVVSEVNTFNLIQPTTCIFENLEDAQEQFDFLKHAIESSTELKPTLIQEINRNEKTKKLMWEYTSVKGTKEKFVLILKSSVVTPHYVAKSLQGGFVD